MKKTVKLISALLVLVLSIMALSSCGLIDYVIGTDDGGNEIPPLPSGGKHRRFDDCLELAGFCNQVKDSLEGRFLYLDLTPALEEGRISDSFYNYWDSYSLHYKESEEGMYIDSWMSSEIKFYAEELGTDTDINMDVPGHSMTLELISLPQKRIGRYLRYEFYSYDSDKYIVKIYSGNVLVAYMNYSTGLDISQEWLISFLNDYLVKI